MHAWPLSCTGRQSSIEALCIAIDARMRWQALLLSLILPSALLLAILALPAPARAENEAASATIKRLRETGDIVLGYYDGNPPFSWVNQDGKVIGYSVEISDHIVNHLAKRLNLPFLATRQVAITLQNRFIMIQNGQIDLECTTTTHTREREKAVAFSNTIFINKIRLLTRKEGPVREFSDLRGKTVAVIGNTRAQTLIEQMSQQMPINVLATHDRDVPPLTILQAGHADAYMNDEAVLYGALARTWRPKDWIITGRTGGVEAYGCTMARRDPAFKQLVDEAIADLMRSGKAEKLYAKWFMSPIPPAGNNLQFPISEQMLQLFRNPNDKAFE